MYILELMYFRILEAFLVCIYVWQIDHYHQTDTLFLVLSCRKLVFDFCETILALRMEKKDAKFGRLMVLSPWDKFGSYPSPILISMSSTFWVSINWRKKHCIQWDTRLHSVSIIRRNCIVTGFSEVATGGAL